MSDPGATHLSLLLVEDDPLYAAIARALLDEQVEQDGGGVEVFHVTTIAEAVELAGAGTVDCALVDLGLPDASGAEGTTRLLAARPDLPVIVLTADRKDETQQAVRDAGARGYVMKGSEDESELWSKLRAAVGGSDGA